MGALAEKNLSPASARWVERVYRTFYDVNLEEAAASGPYPSFDAFFTRELKAGAREVAPVPLVSPADGALSALGPVDSQGNIFVKRQTYDVGELVGSEVEAERYRGGEYAVIYLSPRDYHRVHSPVSGTVSSVVGIPGDLYPVNAVGERHFQGLFVRNNRVVVSIDTPALGRVAVILVGATIVGRITVRMIPEPAVPPGVTQFSPPVQLGKGDELGVFHLGSTVVLLLEPGLGISRGVGPIQVGMALGGAP